ncbi:phage tail protein [Enterobacter asburiae]|uniref:phage tail protein n=1 Tax=Enterobacter asburiae TaxID=61645 RepID=UPI001F28ACAD|nr:phage tail protein [Enterobacter asburiae]
MAKNDFKPFATGAGANVMSQADWEALPALLTGFQSGKASSAQMNKIFRQAGFIAAALAQYTANKSGLDVLDDGDVSGFITKMTTAFGKDFQGLDATLTALAGLATGANKLPYFTGADTAAQTDLTSVGRDIIGQSSIANLLTYLGLQYSISEPDTETVVYTLPGGYKLMAFNRLVNNSTTVGTGVTTPITFPQAFPSRLIAVFATKKNYVQAAVSCENQSLTGFDAVVTLITTIAGGITSTRAMFLAIGK